MVEPSNDPQHELNMSLFKRLLNPNHKSDDKANKAKQSDRSKYFPEEKLPIDEKFTYNFNKNGGKFLYCENMEEVLEAFKTLSRVEGIIPALESSHALALGKTLAARLGSSSQLLVNLSGRGDKDLETVEKLLP